CPIRLRHCEEMVLLVCEPRREHCGEPFPAGCDTEIHCSVHPDRFDQGAVVALAWVFGVARDAPARREDLEGRGVARRRPLPQDGDGVETDEVLVLFTVEEHRRTFECTPDRCRSQQVPARIVELQAYPADIGALRLRGAGRASEQPAQEECCEAMLHALPLLKKNEAGKCPRGRAPARLMRGPRKKLSTTAKSMCWR